MIRFITSRSLRDWGTAIAVVFAIFLLTPRASEAACGDYLHHADHSAAMVHFLPDGLTRTDHHSDDLAKQGAPHRRCQGPNCSGRSFPPPAPPPSVDDLNERWALASVETNPNMVCNNDRLAEPDQRVADGFRLSILRPPR